MEEDKAEGNLIIEEDDLDLPKIAEAKKSFLSPENLLLLSHFFSAWGDRMWMFAVGLYLVELTPNSLRLTAIYGLVVSCMLALFGSTVGRLVDKNPRLKVIRLALLVQNTLVCVSALVILVILFRKPGHPIVLKICEASIIILGSIANLASQASSIAVEKDWVVVVSMGDKDLLAALNAKMRRIDLSCAILAPIAVGLIMSLGSNFAGIIFICGWNILSFFAEYYLLTLVYRGVPRLAIKQSSTDQIDHLRGSVESIHERDEFSRIIEEEHQILVDSNDVSCFQKMLNKIRGFFEGWRIYFKQNVAMAGTSLALLYLTVLGFSSVTTGYVYTQRLSGAVVSVCYGVGSVFGIVGTFAFPRVRKKFGLVKTGTISFWCQWSMLILCIASIWTPGSPSDLYSRHNHLWKKNVKSKTISSSNTTNFMPHNKFVKIHTISQAQRTTPKPDNTNEKFSYVSVSLLLTGLILSRAGLWMTDLTVTQLLQENVAERDRGTVGGTQGAFNAVLDMFHYVLTIVLPKPNQFGILTLISFAAVSLGFIIYVTFVLLKSKDLCLKERDIVSVSSIEWSRGRRGKKDDPEAKGLAALDDDEEELIRGSLQVRSEHLDTNHVL